MVVVLTFGTGGATAGKLITQNSSGVGSSPSKYGYFGYSGVLLAVAAAAAVNIL